MYSCNTNSLWSSVSFTFSEMTNYLKFLHATVTNYAPWCAALFEFPREIKIDSVIFGECARVSKLSNVFAFFGKHPKMPPATCGFVAAVRSPSNRVACFGKSLWVRTRHFRRRVILVLRWPNKHFASDAKIPFGISGEAGDWLKCTAITHHSYFWLSFF